MLLGFRARCVVTAVLGFLRDALLLLDGRLLAPHIPTVYEAPESIRRQDTRRTTHSRLASVSTVLCVLQKGRDDVKAGQLDPYAYCTFNRSMLNRREGNPGGVAWLRGGLYPCLPQLRLAHAASTLFLNCLRQNLIFRYLQNRSRIQVWLYEQVNMRIEGCIIGFDEYMNLVLDDAEEIHSKTKSRKQLGRIMLKGDNITLLQSVSN
ncbi:PREDICTED: small nuclear ribonucleoprotein E [Crocodylus porosus]|uniref:small nuclear ribonucleoprotein E n=1 Tax=Crocodylus porosus TaxID=8502 RepID=UPI00093D11E3|nr:PREDICTED: small nuclear ribonucleoprotein E [Crocodylus porosus]